MEQLMRILSLPRSRVYYHTAEEMHFKIAVTLHASRVERWILAIKRDFLDAAPIKCVCLGCEFSDPCEGRYNKCAAILQLSGPTETLVFQICWADEVPQLLKDFLQDKTIRFCGTTIHKDVEMLCSYKIDIPSAFDLQKITPNPTKFPILSLYDLANSIIGTKLEKKRRKRDKKKDNEEEEENKLIFGWDNVPLSYEQV
ncbi:uncharacterized protein [Lolium perenne]|uniref:uncharacterized protein n=1 Tax=Lolium perenne TaxID=4522 RepID=UPI0021F56A0D|nr:uncharacterized protein LOC127331625 [Lolium perenne]